MMYLVLDGTCQFQGRILHPSLFVPQFWNLKGQLNTMKQKLQEKKWPAVKMSIMVYFFSFYLFLERHYCQKDLSRWVIICKVTLAAAKRPFLRAPTLLLKSTVTHAALMLDWSIDGIEEQNKQNTHIHWSRVIQFIGVKRKVCSHQLFLRFIYPL